MTILTSERRNAALLLTLNRPEAMNALSSALVEALREAVREASRDLSIRGIVVTGAGEKAFSAGTDLKERKTLDERQKAAQSRSLLELTYDMRRAPQPIVAAVSGWCLGGGLELALACDLRFAAEDARFGFPEMTLGAYPGSGGPVTLSRLVGPARAKDILFTARRFDAREALAWGIVDGVVARADLVNAALGWVAQVEATAPLAIAALKKSLNEGAGMGFPDAAEHDQKLRRPLGATKDYAEGMLAHFEKRKPAFRGQ
jgi:enoyl-CoA hydratase/carnithine racemase